MHHHSALQCNLRENLRALLSGRYTPLQENGVVRTAHALARAFLSGKRSSGMLMNLHDLNVSDLAYDCIAEIFQRDPAGSFVQLRAYFNSVPIETITDEELLAHFRRLVFSKVNHGIFRLYSEADPVLARILRNTKLAIASLGQFVEVERFGEQCITPGMCQTLEHLPPLEQTRIGESLLQSTRATESVPDLLARLCVFLRKQNERCRIVPVFVVAHAIRTFYESKRDPGMGAHSAEGTMHVDDVLNTLKQVRKEIDGKFRPKYVGTKLQPETFHTYLQVIEQGLVDRFISGDGSDIALYDRLAHDIPGLTKEMYRKFHKSRLEYLSRQAHDLAVEKLRKEHR